MIGDHWGMRDEDRAGAMGRAFFGVGANLGVFQGREKLALVLTFVTVVVAASAALGVGLATGSILWAIASLLGAGIATMAILAWRFPGPGYESLTPSRTQHHRSEERREADQDELSDEQ